MPVIYECDRCEHTVRRSHSKVHPMGTVAIRADAIDPREMLVERTMVLCSACQRALKVELSEWWPAFLMRRDPD